MFFKEQNLKVVVSFSSIQSCVGGYCRNTPQVGVVWCSIGLCSEKARFRSPLCHEKLVCDLRPVAYSQPNLSCRVEMEDKIGEKSDKSHFVSPLERKQGIHEENNMGSFWVLVIAVS